MIREIQSCLKIKSLNSVSKQEIENNKATTFNVRASSAERSEGVGRGAYDAQ